MKRSILISTGLVTLVFFVLPTTAGAQGSSLDKIYADESYCLTGPEIRSDKDSPTSAIAGTQSWTPGISGRPICLREKTIT